MTLTFVFQAVWYTETPGLEGNVFGSNDMWNGLGVFFDSFDNDGQVSMSEIPSNKTTIKVKITCCTRMLPTGLV